MNKVQKMIYEICREKGISFSLVSKDWIMILEKDHKVRYLCGYKFGLNDHAIGNVCDDKYALYEVLNTRLFFLIMIKGMCCSIFRKIIMILLLR